MVTSVKADNTGVGGTVKVDDTGVGGIVKVDDTGVGGTVKEDDTGIGGTVKADDTGVGGTVKADDSGVAGSDKDGIWVATSDISFNSVVMVVDSVNVSILCDDGAGGPLGTVKIAEDSLNGINGVVGGGVT